MSKKIIIHKLNEFHMNNIVRNKYVIGNKLFKVIFNPGRKRLLKVQPPVFYGLICMWRAISLRKITPGQETMYRGNITIFRHTDTQSVFNKFGHKLSSFIALKYKATGRIGLLFDSTTFNHTIFLKSPLTPQCIGKPYCLILS